MGRSEEYKRYIKSPNWQEKRIERLKLSNYKCDLCSEDINLNNFNCHHKHYFTFGREDPEHDLMALCFECHDGEHDRIKVYKRRLKAGVSNLPEHIIEYMKKIVGWI